MRLNANSEIRRRRSTHITIMISLRPTNHRNMVITMTTLRSTMSTGFTVNGVCNGLIKITLKNRMNTLKHFQLNRRRKDNKNKNNNGKRTGPNYTRRWNYHRGGDLEFRSWSRGKVGIRVKMKNNEPVRWQ